MYLRDWKNNPQSLCILDILNKKVTVALLFLYQVAVRVEERKSFMASVFHNILPQRLKRYDYSYTYEYGSLDFAAAKPSLRPHWQSLYYPLSNEVWIAVLGVMLVMPISLYLVSFLSIFFLKFPFHTHFDRQKCAPRNFVCI